MKKKRNPWNRAANVTATGAAYSKAHYVAREDDTSRSGAVYVFSRLVPSSSDGDSTDDSSAPVCTEDESDGGAYGGLHADRRRFYCPRGGERGGDCAWHESAKFAASDRRGGDLFGSSLSVDHDSGVVVVGAPGASLTGLWREVRGAGCGFMLWCWKRSLSSIEAPAIPSEHSLLAEVFETFILLSLMTGGDSSHPCWIARSVMHSSKRTPAQAHGQLPQRHEGGRFYLGLAYISAIDGCELRPPRGGIHTQSSVASRFLCVG